MPIAKLLATRDPDIYNFLHLYKSNLLRFFFIGFESEEQLILFPIHCHHSELCSFNFCFSSPPTNCFVVRRLKKIIRNNTFILNYLSNMTHLAALSIASDATTPTDLVETTLIRTLTCKTIPSSHCQSVPSSIIFCYQR